MNQSSVYYVKVDEDWHLISDTRHGYNVVEQFTHCQECHVFLSGYDGPRLALCSSCFNNMENRLKHYNVRKIFGQ